MTALGKLTLRLALYGVAVAYLAADLFVFHGPLRRKLDRGVQEVSGPLVGDGRHAVVARVFNRRITRDQLERAVRERLWLDGTVPERLDAENLKLARYAALDGLIDHELLRVKAKAHATRLKVTDAEVDARLRRFAARFDSAQAMEAALKSQSIAGVAEMRERLAALIQQEKYVELKIAPLVTVTGEEARAWFDENREKLAMPERVRVRHVFAPTLGSTDDAARAVVAAALARLQTGESGFAALARELSADPATKDRGGDLGWMSRARLPGDFAAAAFATPVGKPVLLRTRIGWHLIEVTGRLPSEPVAYEDVEAAVIAALEAVKRRGAAPAFRDALRRFEADKIEVFHEVMAR
jgi:peptidyl-prolyl cis-trans isomerase D